MTLAIGGVSRSVALAVGAVQHLALKIVKM